MGAVAYELINSRNTGATVEARVGGTLVDLGLTEGAGVTGLAGAVHRVDHVGAAEGLALGTRVAGAVVNQGLTAIAAVSRNASAGVGSSTDVKAGGAVLARVRDAGANLLAVLSIPDIVDRAIARKGRGGAVVPGEQGLVWQKLTWTVTDGESGDEIHWLTGMVNTG